MSPPEFSYLWDTHFPDVLPLSHDLKFHYEHRWFRIHSLPESKRYAEREDEYQIILDRQNAVISDLLGESEETFIVAGRFGKKEPIEQDSPIYPYGLKFYETLNLRDSPYYDEDELFSIYVAKCTWNKHQHDTLLRAIADWEASAFWVSFENETILAPYDGGMDIILKDTETRDHYKQKYQHWLSTREDGL